MVWKAIYIYSIVYTSIEENSLFTSQDTTHIEKKEVLVQQDLVLGPLLFLININDLENNTWLKVINIANDTMLYETFAKDTYLNDSKSF